MTSIAHTYPSPPTWTIPLGTQVMPDGVHFTIFSRYATRVWILLFDTADAEQPIHEFELTPEENRIGDIWHFTSTEARAGHYYVYRMDGRTPDGIANYFNPKQWLLDPYACAVAGPTTWGSRDAHPSRKAVVSGAPFPKGVIVDHAYDWSGDRKLSIPMSESIIYETHVRGFTAHDSAAVQSPGTYRGIMEKIPYLQDLGITAIELLPIHHFDEMEYLLETGKRSQLRNYWGYSTMAFFAPMSRFAQDNDRGAHVREFKDMVKALHGAGIEVILDVVYNHTAEGNEGGPVYSFKGIANSIYYMMEDQGKVYRNYSGCGNTVNCNHPVVNDLILHSLRYWVTHMHVDGFRFDLATVLARGTNGDILGSPPLIDRISEDPILRDSKLIAEAWDAAGGYQVGSFPAASWSEWNGAYRDDVRRFWKGDTGMLGRLAMRITGSADLYDKNHQTPLKSINFVTCHDGFTMHDLVSYKNKHNLDNGEENRDGEKHNHSKNHGHEGPTTNRKILKLRRQHQKNLLATLFLSQGVPMLLAGDEFSRTQKGNNNAYCQDNALSWVDWSLLEKNKDLHDFVKQLIALRKAHPALRQEDFFHGGKDEGKLFPDIHWLSHNGDTPNWAHDKAMGCLIDGHRNHIGTDVDDHSFFIIFNGSKEPLTFSLPPAPGEPWHQELTTEERPAKWRKGQESCIVPAHVVTVLTSKPIPGT